MKVLLSWLKEFASKTLLWRRYSIFARTPTPTEFS